MTKAICGGLLAGVILAGSLFTMAVYGAPTTVQRNKAKLVEQTLKKATTQAKAKKFKEAGKTVELAQKQIQALAGEGEEMAKLVAPLHEQLTSLHSDLELEGVKLPPIAALPTPAPAPEAKPAATAAAPKPGTPAAPNVVAAGGQVSFTKNITPIFINRCGGCHVRGNKGGMSLLSYESLMKGSKDGVVVAAGRSGGSRLVQLVQEGSMPPSGNKIPDDEIKMLMTWVDQGAKFDGTNASANIADPNLVGGGGRMAKAEVEVQIASGKETIHFSTDIGPVLVDQCYGCHGSGQRAQGNYDMDTFKGVLQGGDMGKAVTPGKPAESYMIKKLRGTATDGVRMPKDKPALSEDVIAKFEKWISEGAKFDGYDVTMNIADLVNVAHAEKISHEELTRERAGRAQHDWKLVLPDGGDDKEETDNFIVFGNTGRDSLKEVAKIAEAQGVKIARALKLPSGPLIKGRIAIFVFDKKYDYGEVGRMMENRDLPKESVGHWKYNVIDADVFILPAKNGEYSLSSLLGQNIASVVVAAQGRIPKWFAEGSGRAMAITLDPKEARYRIWEDQVPAILGSGTAPDTFLKASGEESSILSYAFVKLLRSDPGKYQSLLTAVHSGTPFEAAFQKVYGSQLAQAATAWRGGR